jgi:hypothetical protein
MNLILTHFDILVENHALSGVPVVSGFCLSISEFEYDRDFKKYSTDKAYLDRVEPGNKKDTVYIYTGTVPVYMSHRGGMLLTGTVTGASVSDPHSLYADPDPGF